MPRKPKELPTTPELKKELQEFKQRLLDTASSPNETSNFDVESIRIILEDLNDTDRLLILTCYGVCDGSEYHTSKIFNVSNAYVRHRIKSILKYINKHNDNIKTRHNMPRECYFD